MKRIYLASPFFNAYELSCVQRAEAILQARGFEVFSPRLHEVRDPAVVGMAEWSRETFRSDRDNIDLSDLVVMLYHGAYSDSGTAWEAGYACGTCRQGRRRLQPDDTRERRHKYFFGRIIFLRLRQPAAHRLPRQDAVAHLKKSGFDT